jgi:hypothetical protein
MMSFRAPQSARNLWVVGVPGPDSSPSFAARNDNKNVERTCKPNSVLLTFARSEDHSSATRVAAVVKQPTRKLSTETGDSTASLFGLAPQGVCHAVAARAGRGALLPHRFTLTSATLRSQIGGLFSVALSVALPRLDVIQPAARRSSDFPPSFHLRSGRRSSGPLHDVR